MQSNTPERKARLSFGGIFTSLCDYPFFRLPVYCDPAFLTNVLIPLKGMVRPFAVLLWVSSLATRRCRDARHAAHSPSAVHSPTALHGRRPGRPVTSSPPWQGQTLPFAAASTRYPPMSVHAGHGRDFQQPKRPKEWILSPPIRNRSLYRCQW